MVGTPAEWSAGAPWSRFVVIAERAILLLHVRWFVFEVALVHKSLRGERISSAVPSFESIMLLGTLDSCLLALFFFLLYKAYGRLRSRSTLLLPPGPRRLPIIGSVHQLPLEHQYITFMDWKETYGVSISLNFIYKHTK